METWISTHFVVDRITWSKSQNVNSWAEILKTFSNIYPNVKNEIAFYVHLSILKINENYSVITFTVYLRTNV